MTNHAGRQVDGAVGSLEVLLEIAEAVGDSTYRPVLCVPARTILTIAMSEMTIIFDSGVRTGADVFKAIALGAHVVAIGRLFVWGMAHEGEYGCRHVLKSLLAVRSSRTIKQCRGLFWQLGLGYPDDCRWVPEHHEGRVQEQEGAQVHAERRSTGSARPCDVVRPERVVRVSMVDYLDGFSC